jgi:electron transport complex protein RnfE
MGVFIPLIVVNCIIMGRVEAFSSKQPPLAAIADGLGMGLGYTWVLTGISLIRELLGNGSILDIPILSGEPILFFTLAPGGFLVFSFFISFGLWLKSRSGAAADRDKAGCC